MFKWFANHRPYKSGMSSLSKHYWASALCARLCFRGLRTPCLSKSWPCLQEACHPTEETDMSQTLSFSWDWEAQNFPSPGTWVTNPSQAKVTMNSDKWVSEWELYTFPHSSYWCKKKHDYLTKPASICMGVEDHIQKSLPFKLVTWGLFQHLTYQRRGSEITIRVPIALLLSRGFKGCFLSFVVTVDGFLCVQLIWWPLWEPENKCLHVLYLSRK